MNVWPDWLQVLIVIVVLLALPFLAAFALKLAFVVARCWTAIARPFEWIAVKYLTALKSVIEWAGKEPGK